MKHVLARAQLGLLETYARPGTLLALDFDGTLAPIVRHPQRARLRSSTRRLLRRAAASYPTVVISGRARDDVKSRVAGTGVLEVVGNHGIEPWDASASHERLAAAWRTLLVPRLQDEAGIFIEDKRFSLAVHYRGAPRIARARAAILAAVSDLRGLRLVPGKRVLNLLPQAAAHKGTGFEEMCTRLGCSSAVYVGDDETDEDVFSLRRPSRLLSIRIGRKSESAAVCYLRNQGEIDDLLETLVRLYGGG